LPPPPKCREELLRHHQRGSSIIVTGNVRAGTKVDIVAVGRRNRGLFFFRRRSGNVHREIRRLSEETGTLAVDFILRLKRVKLTLIHSREKPRPSTR